MTVKDYIDKRNNGIDTSKVLMRTYIPFVEKVQIIDAIIDSLTYEANGMITYDTNELEMNKVIAFIKSYMDLEFENGVSDYDLLMEYGFASLLFSRHDSIIGEDIFALDEMVDNKLRDLKREHNSIEALVNNKLGIVVDALTETINNLNGVLTKTDTKKLNTTLSKGVKDIINALQVK